MACVIKPCSMLRIFHIHVAQDVFAMQRPELPSEDPGELEMYEEIEQEIWKRGGEPVRELLGDICCKFSCCI
jgi:hypothetical protein